MTKKASTQGVKRNQSVGKVISIIEVMAGARGSMRLQEIAAALEQPPSTVLRFLNTLMDRHYVSQDPETLRYGLTLKICQVADWVRSQIAIRDVARPYLVSLAQNVEESTCLAIEESGMVVYVDVVDGPDHMLQTLQRIGKRAPLHSTGVRKALLMNYDGGDYHDLLERHPLEALTEETITDLATLRAEVEAVRSRGYALDNEECETGVRCVAAPVFDYSGRVQASISVSGPAARMTRQKIENCSMAVRDNARAISERLGYVAN